MKAIITKYIGRTHTKGPRIKASDNDGNSITVLYDSAFSVGHNHNYAALALFRKMVWSDCVLVRGWLGTRAVFVIDDNSEKIHTSKIRSYENARKSGLTI